MPLVLTWPRPKAKMVRRGDDIGTALTIRRRFLRVIGSWVSFFAISSIKTLSVVPISGSFCMSTSQGLTCLACDPNIFNMDFCFDCLSTSFNSARAVLISPHWYAADDSHNWLLCWFTVKWNFGSHVIVHNWRPKP